MEEYYDCPKLTPKKWIENFWYYYKWFFLLGVVVVTFVTICTVQYFTKDDADCGILIVSKETVKGATCKNIVTTAEKMALDVNEDGKVSVIINAITLHSGLSILDRGEREQAREDYKRYSDEILAGESCILILDEYYFLSLAENGNLVNLHAIFPELPKEALNEYGIRLKDTALYSLDGFSELSGDMILCLKFAPVLSDMGEEERVNTEIANEETFRSLYKGVLA